MLSGDKYYKQQQKTAVNRENLGWNGELGHTVVATLHRLSGHRKLVL